MNIINYEIFHCPTVSTVIYGKSNVLRNWTRKNISYYREILFNCYFLQGHVTDISHTLILLLVIQLYLFLRYLLIHQLHVW